MKKTKEELAQIARENGAKSRGPITEEGKAKVSLNALKTGEHSAQLAALVPAHFATICNEDREGFDQFFAELTNIYRPTHLLAENIVGDIAAARWQIERYNRCITMNWDFTLLTTAKRPLTLDPVLETMETSVRATAELFGGAAIIARLNREVMRLQKQILFLEKHLAYVHKTFVPGPVPVPEPEPAPEPAPTPSQKVENKPTVTTTECDPEVIAAYRRHFPNHQILIVPAVPDRNDGDNNPKIPRKAA